jgi:hypothetical protein
MSLIARRTPTLPLGALPRVDLLPASEMRRRDVRARIRTWIWVAIASALVAVLAVGAALAVNMGAALRLGSEQARTLQIMTGIGGLSDVSTALSTRTELQALRGEAMSGDLDWQEAIDTIAAVLPPGVSIAEYAFEAGGAASADTDADADAGAAAVGVTGTVTLRSTAPLDFVAVTRDLRARESVQEADVDDFSSTDGVYSYRLHVTLDQSVYTRAYGADE